MSGAEREDDRVPLRRVPVILRSWDGPNSRIGLEVDLEQIPWGPFDALGQRLSLLLPVDGEPDQTAEDARHQIERALRHVEHAADRCGEFAQLGNSAQDLWLKSQRTWEFIRRYLTRLWIETAVEGGSGADGSDLRPASASGSVAGENLPTDEEGFVADWPPGGGLDPSSRPEPLREALATPEREPAPVSAPPTSPPSAGEAERPSMPAGSPPAPPDEAERGSAPPQPPKPAGGESPARRRREASDPDHVSFEFARGYDEGYQMGRRVGLALGAREASEED